MSAYGKTAVARFRFIGSYNLDYPLLPVIGSRQALIIDPSADNPYPGQSEAFPSDTRSPAPDSDS
jgi:hypothetical protein